MTSFENIIRTTGQGVDATLVEQLIRKVTEVVNYTPRIGILGKTGAGKSSLCNALFGAETCKVSDVEACTRQEQEVTLEVSEGHRIVLVDVPGVGENPERDEEYAALYERLLPDLDMVLWVIKADDRALSVDKDFYHQVVRPHIGEGMPFLIVLNQVDKLEPLRDWDMDTHQPGAAQRQTIERKIADVAKGFGIREADVIPVSGTEGYGLTTLVDNLIRALPDEKRVSVLRRVRKEYRSPESVSVTRRSLLRVLQGTVSGGMKGAKLGARIGSHLGPKAAVVGSWIGGVVGAVGGFLGLW